MQNQKREEAFREASSLSINPFDSFGNAIRLRPCFYIGTRREIAENTYGTDAGLDAAMFESSCKNGIDIPVKVIRSFVNICKSHISRALLSD